MSRSLFFAAVLTSCATAVSFVACSADQVGTAPTGADASVSDADAAVDETSTTCAPFDAGAIDDAQAQLGLSLIVANKCQQCHTSQLSGNNLGVTAPSDEGGLAYPPNLTPDPATGLGCWTTAQVTRAILDGIDDQGQPLCPPMPQFGHIDGGLDEAQATAIALYLRTLPPVSNPTTPQTSCPAALDAGSDATDDGGAPDAADASDTTVVDAPADVPDVVVDSGTDATLDSTPDATVDDSTITDAGTDSPDDSTLVADAPDDSVVADATDDADATMLSTDAADETTPDASDDGDAAGG